MTNPLGVPSHTIAAPPRRRIATVIDGVAAIAALLGLYFGLMDLNGLVGYSSGLLDGILWVGPCLLWLALLLTLAWCGQTPGLALLRLRWVDPRGARARWRPAGEPHFWCLALSALVLLAPFVVMSLWVLAARLIWAVAHVSIGFPGSAAVPSCAVVALLIMLGLARLARRHPAVLVRAERRTESI